MFSNDIIKKITMFLLGLCELRMINFLWVLGPEGKVFGDLELVIFSDKCVKAFGSIMYMC